MKEIKIPFSLSEYQKGGYVVKCGKHEARVLCTDFSNNEGQIVCAVKSLGGNTEYIQIFNKDGEYISGKPSELNDLFLIKQEFEDGDIITRKDPDVPFILPYRGTYKTGGVLTDVYYYCDDKKIIFFNEIERGCGDTQDFRMATEEEKKIFFDALARDGKKWNAEKKCIEDIEKQCEFKPFDKVLVRDSNEEIWNISLFGFTNTKCPNVYPFFVLDSNHYMYCIPYNDETSKLIGTANDCPEKYKIWRY